jgi:hypothetical protein
MVAFLTFLRLPGAEIRPWRSALPGSVPDAPNSEGKRAMWRHLALTAPLTQALTIPTQRLPWHDVEAEPLITIAQMPEGVGVRPSSHTLSASSTIPAPPFLPAEGHAALGALLKDR